VTLERDRRFSFMNTELVHAIHTRSNGVYLLSKNKGDDAPYRLRKSDRLTRAYTQNGQKGLDVEFVKMLVFQFGEIQGNHPSVTRFRPCMEQSDRLRRDAVTAIEGKYSELALTDEMLREPDSRRSLEAKEYQMFHEETMRDLFEQIASLADPPPPDKKRDAGAR
jgi:hypothetical protein